MTIETNPVKKWPPPAGREARTVLAWRPGLGQPGSGMWLAAVRYVPGQWIDLWGKPFQEGELTHWRPMLPPPEVDDERIANL